MFANVFDADSLPRKPIGGFVCLYASDWLALPDADPVSGVGVIALADHTAEVMTRIRAAAVGLCPVHSGARRIWPRLCSSHRWRCGPMNLLLALVVVLLILSVPAWPYSAGWGRSEEHTSELQSRFDLVCRLLLEKKKNL